MPTDSDYRWRFTVELRKDQGIALQKMLPHGMKRLLFQALVDGIIALYNRGGFEAVGLIISGHVSVAQLAEAGKDYTAQTIQAESTDGGS